MAPDEIVERLLAQQAALAGFGSFALSARKLDDILSKAAVICAECLKAPYCRVCRFRPEHNDLLIEAGFGWHPHTVGTAVSPADLSSPGGRAYVTGEPVICTDFAKEEGFVLPDFYAQHNIASSVNVIIRGSEGTGAYGILEINSHDPRAYDQHDINFLTTFANVLAEAVGTAQRIESLRAALAEKDVLARELQHRVRNNLHLISSMLTLEAGSQPQAEESFLTIGTRVQALATVYDHLLGVGMARVMALDKYLRTLCETMRNFRTGLVQLIDRPMPSVMVDLDTATAIGLAVTELITNSYRHAFPTGSAGTIEVALDYRGQVPVLTVQDDGIGVDTVQLSKRHGLGLVQRLVEQIDAAIEMRQTGKGTRYEIELSRVAAT